MGKMNILSKDFWTQAIARLSKETTGTISSGDVVTEEVTTTLDKSLWGYADTMLNLRIFKVQQMPLSKAAQNDAVARIFQSEFMHIKNDDGSYYIAIGDKIMENRMNPDITADNVQIGSPEFKKVMALLRKGRVDTNDIKSKPGLTVIK
jgi:hypothetical protein